jgi:hypothetical protein
MKMKTLFDNYEISLKYCGEALKAFKNAQDDARSYVITIVKKLQTEKGYVKFAYGHRPEIYGCDLDEITYIRYDYEVAELQVLSRNQNVKPESKKACWKSLRKECGFLYCYESIMRELRNIVEK